MKQFAILFLWVNIAFVVINSALMYFSPVPAVNFVAGIASLLGAWSSWNIYTSVKD